jgi:hypothetical protein
MTPSQPTVPWRGYVNMLVHDLRTPVADEMADRLATELIRQRFFTDPVADFHDALVDALRSGRPVAMTDDQDDANIRALLTRVVALLDERRPWPEPPYQALDTDQWDTLRGAPVVGRMAMHRRDVEARLNRGFATAGTVEVLVLRLRTGQTMGLCAGPSGVELLTHAEPGSAVAAFRELTGLEIGRAGPSLS